MIKHFILYSILIVLLAISITLNFSQLACFNSAYSISIDPLSSAIGLITLIFAAITINAWQKEKKFEIEVLSRKELYFELIELSKVRGLINSLKITEKITNDDYCDSLNEIQKLAFKNQLTFFEDKIKNIKNNLSYHKSSFGFLANKALIQKLDDIILVLDVFSNMSWLTTLKCDKEFDMKSIYDSQTSDTEAHTKRKKYLVDNFPSETFDSKISEIQKKDYIIITVNKNLMWDGFQPPHKSKLNA